MEISKSSKKVVVLTELERKRKSVGQLQMKLKSYLCEPQTYCGFVKKENLRTNINQAATKTDSLLAILKMNDISMHESINDVERQIEELYDLEQEVALNVLNR